MPITDPNISMRQSQKLKHLNEPITKIQTFKYANRKKRQAFQYANHKKTFKYANHRHKNFNEPITARTQ